MNINYRELGVGLASYLPPLRRRIGRTTGGTTTARYCYAVWLRHLCLAHASGLPTDERVVAELGPGDSLGVGLAALLSGAQTYYALDTVPYRDAARDLAIYDDLVRLFVARAPIPDDTEFPRVWPTLDSYAFPAHILDEDRLSTALTPRRLATLRTALRSCGQQGGMPARGRGDEDVTLAYMAPWSDPTVVAAGTVGMIISQAVLEYPVDLAATYRAMDRWLRPGGFMTHTIPFNAHGLAKTWNGHWLYPDPLWALIVGRRPYAPNREPHSTHVKLLEGLAYTIACDRTMECNEGIERARLAPRFRDLSDDDVRICGAVIQAVKPTLV